MLDHTDFDPDVDQPSDPPPNQLQGAYPPQLGQFYNPQQQAGASDYYQPPLSGPHHEQQRQQQQQPPQPPQMMQVSQADGPEGPSGPFDMGQAIDPSDPMLNTDPFGLSASMHYPTSYGAMGQDSLQR